MDYGEILTKAWKIIWKHKILWLFGILAGCGSGGRNSSNYDFNSSGTSITERDYTDLPPELRRFFISIQHFIQNNVERIWLYALLFISVIMIISLVLFLLRVYGQVGLVRGVMLVESGSMDEGEKLTFGQIHAEVSPYFWRLAGLRLLIFLIMFVVAVVIALIVFFGTTVTLGLGLLCIIPAVCLLVPVFWAISVVIKQAELAIIAEDLDVLKALSRGYNIVRQNLGVYAIMALILMVGGAIVTFLIALPQLLAVAPILAALINSAVANNWSNILTGLWISVGCLVGYWPVLLVLGGILTSFVESSWLLTFMETTRYDEDLDDLQTIEPELETL